MFGDPNGHPGEGGAVGEIQPPHLEDRVDAEYIASPLRGRDEAELEHPPFRGDAIRRELVLECAEAAKGLT